MNRIYFRMDKELIYFCDVFFQMYHEIQVNWKKNKFWGNELQFTDQSMRLQQVIPIFVEVFMSHRLDKMIRQIAEQDYFYSDDAEIERICQLTKWLMTEEETEQVFFQPHLSLFDFMYGLFQEHMTKDEPIHFDALMTFCMKPLSACLVEAVGCGIDEMKREEEQQSFIQTAREYVQQRQSRVSTLYIVQDENFVFYNTLGEQYSRTELRLMMQQEPLYLIGLDENEYNLSPVMTLLPEKILLFGDRPEEAKVNTLLSLFQERVTIYPLAEFPFAAHSK